MWSVVSCVIEDAERAYDTTSLTEDNKKMWNSKLYISAVSRLSSGFDLKEKTMLKNYIKIAFRNLRKQKLYSLINILGLALGLAFCVLVLLFINDELTYDHFHTDKDRIYRLFREPVAQNSPIDRELYMPIPTGPAMKANFPEVEEYVRLTPFGTNVVRHEGQLYDQDDVVFSDPQVFDVFTFPMIAGNAETALSDSYSTVITSGPQIFWKDKCCGRSFADPS